MCCTCAGGQLLLFAAVPAPVAAYLVRLADVGLGPRDTSGQVGLRESGRGGGDPFAVAGGDEHVAA